MHASVDALNNECTKIVLPHSKRAKALKLAHENTAHVGVRVMRRILGARFVWPGIHGDRPKNNTQKLSGQFVRTNQSLPGH